MSRNEDNWLAGRIKLELQDLGQLQGDILLQHFVEDQGALYDIEY